MLVSLSLYEFISLGMLGGQSPVEHDSHAEGRQVDRPGFDDRIKKRDMALRRQGVDLGVQKLEDHYSYLFIASVRESRDEAEPVLVLEFLSCDLLHDVQKPLRDETFKFAEGLLFKDRAYLLFFV